MKTTHKIQISLLIVPFIISGCNTITAASKQALAGKVPPSVIDNAGKIGKDLISDEKDNNKKEKKYNKGKHSTNKGVNDITEQCRNYCAIRTINSLDEEDEENTKCVKPLSTDEDYPHYICSTKRTNKKAELSNCLDMCISVIEKIIQQH